MRKQIYYTYITSVKRKGMKNFFFSFYISQNCLGTTGLTACIPCPIGTVSYDMMIFIFIYMKEMEGGNLTALIVLLERLVLMGRSAVNVQMDLLLVFILI